MLKVARRSIQASKAPGRQRAQVEDEAVAAICGVSWVYQRTERLAEALTEAERSLDLGLDIYWDRNTAFCHKCIGRLKRMEAEATQDDRQRTALLKESFELLSQAIDEFTKLGLEAEVGDCYSLLARTHFVDDDRQAARNAIAEADDRLVDPTTKDFLDLQILSSARVHAIDCAAAVAALVACHDVALVPDLELPERHVAWPQRSPVPFQSEIEYQFVPYSQRSLSCSPLQIVAPRYRKGSKGQWQQMLPFKLHRTVPTSMLTCR